MMIVIQYILLKLMFNILKIYISLTIIYSFCRKKMKIEKVSEVVANFHDQEEYVMHRRHLKETLNHGFALKKVLLTR